MLPPSFLAVDLRADFLAVDLRADLDLPVFDRAREVHAHDLEVELADARPAGGGRRRERRRPDPSRRKAERVARRQRYMSCSVEADRAATRHFGACDSCLHFIRADIRHSKWPLPALIARANRVSPVVPPPSIEGDVCAAAAAGNASPAATNTTATTMRRNPMHSSFPSIAHRQLEDFDECLVDWAGIVALIDRR